MSVKLPGKAKSFWVDSTPESNFPQLEEGLKVDVAIIGGGIVGITTAIMLKDAGKTVALIEADRIIKDVTSTTTAKVSAHTIYSMYIKKLGENKTQLYAMANLKAVETVHDLVSEYNIDCDFRRTPCYFYSESKENIDLFKTEAELGIKLGLPVSYIEDVPIKTGSTGVVYQNQAEFHPRKYLLALANEISGENSYIFENTRILDINEGNPHEVVTNQGSIKADNVVVATHFPLYDPDKLYTQLNITRSYILAYYTKEKLPKGMFVCINPFHTYRSIPTGKGEMIMIAGEHQVVGSPIDTRQCYKNLEKYARDHWEIESIEYHWSNQDNNTPDGLPVIGETSKPGIYVATGFGGWGMTHGTNAGELITDLIIGEENPLTELFDPLRFKDMKPATSSDDEKLEISLKFKDGKIPWPSKLDIPELHQNDSPGSG